MPHRPRACLAGAAVLIALGCAAPPARAAGNAVDVSVVPDAASIRPTQLLGFTIAVDNPRAARVTLASDLPAGGDLSWAVDRQTGIGGCAVTGQVGDQALSCPPASRSYSLHVFSHTWNSTAPEVTVTARADYSHNRSATGAGSAAVVHPSCRDSQPDSSRQLLFDDEFNGDTIDTGKWTVGSLPFAGLDGSRHYHNRQYGSYVVPEDSFVKDGILELTTNDTPVTDPDVPSIGTIPYTEGMIHTKGKFSTYGGYFEICAKFPAGVGMWPAFWLVAENGVWPPEIDVAEWFGGLEAMQLGQPWATGAPPVWQTAGSKWLSTWSYSNAPTTGYHDYAVWWSPGSPGTDRYYIDGQMVHEVDGGTEDLIPGSPLYMILNSGTWAGRSRGGPPDATTVFPNSFDVDYARVYKTPPPQDTDYTAP